MIPYAILLLSCLAFYKSGVAQLSGDSLAIVLHSEKDLFDSDKLLDITIKGNVHDLLNDREGVPKYFPLSLTYRREDSSEISIPVNIKTRGHFRRLRQNCFYPPLQIQFTGNNKQPLSMFPAKAKLKLVMPCKGDEYVVREWLVYKLYNLVTPESLRARLVRVTLENEKGKKHASPFFGILLEEEEQMAKRNNAVIITRKIKPRQALPGSFLNMTVFQYLIGNTDWSVEYLQNVKLMGADSMAVPVTVPYDFDHAGIVNAPYALPAEELRMTSCRQRRYRGYCIQDMTAYDNTIAYYNRLKNDIYGLYTNCKLVDSKYIKSTVQYFDEFYKIINSPKRLKEEFGYPCDESGTGNVVIHGLKED